MHSAESGMDSSLQACRPDPNPAFDKCDDTSDDVSLMAFYLEEIGHGLLLPVCGEEDMAPIPADLSCDSQADQHTSANDDHGGGVGGDGHSEELSLCDNLIWDSASMEKMLNSSSYVLDSMDIKASQDDEGFVAAIGGVTQNIPGLKSEHVDATECNASHSALCADETPRKLTPKAARRWRTFIEPEPQAKQMSRVSQAHVGSTVQYEEWLAGEGDDDCAKWPQSGTSHYTSATGNVRSAAHERETDDNEDGDGGGRAASHGKKTRKKSTSGVDSDTDKGITKKQIRFWGTSCGASLSRGSSDEISESKASSDIARSEYHSRCSCGHAEEGRKLCKQDQQQGCVCGGFATGTAAKSACMSASAATTSKNLVSERIRRHKLNEKLFNLRALVPNISKMNKASIVGDAIEYVRDLRKQIEDTKSEIAKLETCREELKSNMPRVLHHYKDTHQIAKWSSKRPTNLLVYKVLELEMIPMEGKLFQLRLHCKRSPGLLVQLARALEALNIDVINGNMTSINDRILSTLVIEVNDPHLMKSEDLRAKTLKDIQSFGLLPEEKID